MSKPSMVKPRPAMINENSPIWQKQKPLCMAAFSGRPLSSTPMVADRLLKTITVPAITKMGTIYSTSTAGSTSMPTDTKKMAPKRFFSGVTTRWMTSASMVSLKMAPITKAPRAVEKPALEASTTMPRQRPTAKMRSVSSDMYLRIQRRKVGMR